LLDHRIVFTAVRPLVVAVLAVVASFIFALWLSQHRLNDVEADVYEVAANAEPSVVYLENARTELERTGLYVDECVAALADHLPTAQESRVRASAAHARMLEFLETYERVPFFPGEGALYRDARTALGPVDLAIRTVLERADAGELDSATLELLDDLHPDMELFDEKLQVIVRHDTAYAVKKLEEIAESRRRSWTAAIIGGSFSMVLSALATTLATFAMWKAAAARREVDREHGARLAAEREIRRRDEFLSLVTHELRTPLAALQLAVEALTRKPERQSPALRSAAVRQVSRMNALVEELILVAQLDLGSFAITRTPVDLFTLVRDRLQAHESSIAQSGSDVSLHGEAPVIGQWDARALGRIVDKLLTNALRFGRGNPIDVTVSRHEGKARLVVRDRGIGIPPHRIDAVFARFERGVSQRNYPGLGLGLFIARSLVQAMGGTIVATSSPSEGTTFTVELPLQVETAAATTRVGSGGIGSADGTPRTPQDVPPENVPPGSDATR
jgi:signal transduction histidine kinase